MLTIRELSNKFNVSTKTISRWRGQGLVSCRFVSDGRQRIGFLQSSVDSFVRQHQDQVRRGAQFCHLSADERRSIVSGAQHMAQQGRRPAEIIRRLARETGRSTETIRYTLKRFDHENPEAAVLSDSHGLMEVETRREIYHRYRRGEAVEALARRFACSRRRLYRIIAKMRFEHIKQLPLSFIPNERFPRVRPDSAEEKAILGPAPSSERSARKVRRPAGLPPYLASLYETPLLSRQQEAHLFRKMNYLKYRASTLAEQLDPAHPSAALMDRIESLYDQAVVVKNEIVAANLRLVVSIAKRYANRSDRLFELISDGNVSLMRAAEKFDFARGFKFSTYATWAIIKNFARTIPTELRHQIRFRTSREELFTAAEEDRAGQQEQETAQTQRERQIAGILGRLPEREKRIITCRFGLERGREPMTLQETGTAIGVTKERIRQLEGRALAKLRAAAQQEQIEAPDRP